jgi:hypothetical protein
MPQKAAALAKARLQVLHVVDVHGLQGAVQEHGAVEAGGMVAHLGDDVGVAEHHQGGIGVRRAGESPRVAGFLGGAELQRGIAQGIRQELGLVHRTLVDDADGQGIWSDGRLGPVLVEPGEGIGEVQHSAAKGGDGLEQVLRDGAHGSVLRIAPGTRQGSHWTAR